MSFGLQWDIWDVVDRDRIQTQVACLGETYKYIGQVLAPVRASVSPSMKEVIVPDGLQGSSRW